MDKLEIEKRVEALQSDTVASEEEAWEALKPLGSSVVPYLLRAYPKFKKYSGRVSLVFHAIRYAKVSEKAFELGSLALQDKSKVVRYRACMLMAYSQREEALPLLRSILSSKCEETIENARAAIDAIESKNHHYFVDRDHSGKSFWVVNDEDRNN